MVETVRIFLTSPRADTLEARARVVEVVGEVNADPLYAPHVRLDLRRWDDPARPIVCDRAGNPQQDIVQQVGSPGECDLVIGIFAHTMGGTLPMDRFPVPQGRVAPWYCTEWEVEQGLQARRTVWLFHDLRPLTMQTAKTKRELLAVSEYIERYNLSGDPMREGFNPFKDPDDLADRLRHRLHTWLTRQFIDRQVDGPPDSPTIDLRPYLQRRSAQWRTSAGGRLSRRFVNLKLRVDQGLEHDGPHHEVQGEYDRLADLLAEWQDVGAWVLVGDPGSGKSAILQHHEMTTTEAALAADAGSLPEVCVWRRLSEYGHDSAEPAAWLAQHWPRDLPPLEALRGVARVRFLLDGLNEIKAPDRTQQLKAIERWTTWAAQQAHNAAGDVLAPIFSVRTLDQSPLSTHDFEVRRITIVPLGHAKVSRPFRLLPPVMPFRWACAYGEDRIGLWQAFEVAGVRQVLRWIPPGEFLMGSPEDEAERFDDERQHRVVLTEGFWLADTACTQALWVAVMDANPSRFKDDPQNPVEQVSWLDITDSFLPKLNALAPGLQLELPTEAQLEYACRAGTTTPFSFGEQITTDQVNYDGNYPYAGSEKGEYREKTMPVKALPANPWGLHQMHGNVYEWCVDEYAEYSEGTVENPVVHQDKKEGRQRVLRGGSWFDLGRRCRSAYRHADGPGLRDNDVGFRLARRAC